MMPRTWTQVSLGREEGPRTYYPAATSGLFPGLESSVAERLRAPRSRRFGSGPPPRFTTEDSYIRAETALRSYHKLERRGQVHANLWSALGLAILRWYAVGPVSGTSGFLRPLLETPLRMTLRSGRTT